MNRLVTTRGWSPTIYGNANQIYGDASTSRFVKHGNGTGYRPAQGDIVVWGGGWHGYGHVAVVEADSGGLLTVVEQNATPSGYGTYRISSSGYIARTSSGYYVEGYLHAKANPIRGGGSGPVPSTPPASPVPQGKDSIGMYFPWDHTMHLRNELSSGPSDYAFSYGASSNGVEGVPLVGDWNGD